MVVYMGFSGGSGGKESTCIAGDPGSILGLGRSPGERSGYQLQYPCLEDSMDRGAWWATYSPWGHKEADTAERLTHCVLGNPSLPIHPTLSFPRVYMSLLHGCVSIPALKIVSSVPFFWIP